MNIELQLGGLLVLILLLILYVSKKSLNLYSEKIFVFIMVISTFILFTDIMSVWAIKYQDELPFILVQFICKLYLCLLILIVCMQLIYILYDVLGEKRHKQYLRYFIVLILIESIVIFTLPINTYIEGRTVYTYGLATKFTYIFVLIYLLAGIGVAIKYKKLIYSRRLFAFSLWISLWVLFAIIQFVDSKLLVVGYSSVLGIVVLFIMLENPESNIDQKLGCFNALALSKYLNQLYANNTEFHIIYFFLEDSGVTQENNIKRIVRKLKNNNNLYIFKSLSMDFFVITTSRDKFYSIKKENDENCIKYADKFKNINMLIMEDAHKIKSAEKVEPFFAYFSEKQRKLKEQPVIEITDDMVEEFTIRNQMIDEIKNALSEDRVEIFLQPIYQMETDSFTSAEVLTRIRKEDGSLIPPGLFIPVAEESGLINELGKRIFEKTCRFISEYKPYEKGVEYLEINLSVVQCEQNNLAEELIETMKQYGVSAQRINLEITETATLISKKKMLENMNTLIEKGCIFSLDDFGKGQSNFMYIVDMPVDIIKLDYDMTKAYNTTPKARSIIRSVVVMAHEMGLSVIAEGIETKEELDNMKDMNIDYIQGFYFSKPIPIEEYAEFIEANNK